MPIIVLNKVNEDLAGRSGTAFSSNALDTINTTFTLELNTMVNLSAELQVVKLGSLFTLTGGNWNDLIASFVGATIDFRLGAEGTGNPTQSTTVVSVNGADMELTIDGSYADGAYSIGFFQITSIPEQFEFNVNLVENNVQSGTASLIDSEAQRFSATLDNALTISGLTDNLIQLGNKSGGSQFTTTTIERIADNAVNGNKQYEVIVIYKNWLCINDTPYFAKLAVGDYYEFQMFMINGDPSVVVPGTYFQTGNTGFVDENFNGKPSDYTLTSIAWEDDLANATEAFDYTANSNFTIVISGASLNLADTFNFKMFTLPNDATEYQNKSNPVENNLMLAINPTLMANASSTNITGNLDDSGAGFDIQDLEITVVAGVSVTFIGKVIPNAAFTSLFSGRDVNDRAYKIWIQCEDSTDTFKTANTVNVLAEDAQAQEDILPLGAWPDVTTLEFEDHNNDVYAGRPDPYLEDDVLSNVEFTLPKDVVANPWLSITGRIVAERISDGERFIIEEFVYDVSGLPTNTTTGILPLDYTQNRGFKLPATSDKHDVSIQLFPSLDDGSNFGVQMRYPFIVRYEDWIPLPQANDDFFGSKTQNWFQYSDNADWNIQFEIALETESGEYINEVEFDIHDYNDWGEAPGSAASFLLDAVLVTKPFADAITQVTFTHEVDTEDWNGNEWATIHVRPENGAPQWLIGSVLDHSDNNNALLPLTGSTKAKLSTTTKIVTVEALFDPSKDIDLSGDITFTSRISGSTTGGQKGNVFKQTYTPAKSKLLPQLRRKNDPVGEENRGYVGCCDPFLVLADQSTDRNKNDITSPREFGDSVDFILTKDGVVTTYTPISIQFPNQPDAWYARIEWFDVNVSDGVGCYSIDIVRTVAGNVQPSVNWGKYVLKQYDKDGYLHARYTARLFSQFNDVNNFDGINYTDSFLEDSLRIFNGKFGYFQPNTEVDFVEQLDGTNQKVKTEDFFEYELRTDGVTMCIVNELLVHLRGMTNCWMSSYNYDDFDYEDLSMKNVILSEGFVAEHKDGSRLIDGVVKFKDKKFTKSSNFQDNRQTSESSPVPVVGQTIVITATGATPLKTGQLTSFRTGDDGDLEAGRELNHLTLGSNNPYGNTTRFLDTTGATAYTDGVVIDWSTFDGSTVLGYTKAFFGVIANWQTCIDNAIALSLGTYTSGWRVTNRRELTNLFDYSLTPSVLGFAPFFINNTINLTTSTTYAISTSNIYISQVNSGLIITQAKSAGTWYIACRTFTVTGTVLT